MGQVMTSENVNALLASTRALDQDGDVLRVAVRAPFNKGGDNDSCNFGPFAFLAISVTSFGLFFRRW